MPFAPLPADESHRLATLHATGILDSPADDSFDVLAQSAARLTGSRMALIGFLDTDREWFKATHGWDGLPVREIPRDLSFCSYALLGAGLFEVADASIDPRFHANPFVIGAPHVRAYAGEPLLVDGTALGALCVADPQPRTLDTDQRASLKRLARVASELLAQRRRRPPVDDERSRLLDFARASGDWMWETDADLRYLWLSPNFETVTGLSPGALKGQAMADSPLFDGLGRPLSGERHVHALLRRHQPLTRVITSLYTPRGLIQVSLSAVPVFDAQGAFAGYRGTARDVTQHTAHEQLRSDKEAAERASRAKSEFLSRVSHELRTPLNGILGFAQLMAIDRVHPLEPDQARRLDSVMRAGRHLLELINDMLNLARIEQEDFSLQPGPVNLTSTVQTCYSLVQPLADSAGVRLAALPSQAHWAHADPRAVEQVLLNLLSNAIKYNRPAGQVKVTVRRAEAHVEVAVSDEGEGLSEAQQAHLFQPFNRLGAEQRRVEGTGLGLVIARDLAAAMSGKLRVESHPGLGSTFTLQLPTGNEPATATAAEQAQPADTPLATPQPVRRRMLYVEDEPLNVLLMQEVFKARPHWELEIATDGASGLAAARTQSHDLILVDMNLPDMNGLELIRKLRTGDRTAGMRCIALSADAMQTQIDAALAAGFDDYWTKPINVAHILDGLGQALDRA